MSNPFIETNFYEIPAKFPSVKRGKLDTLQVNLGYLCNQTCRHCHVNAGPNRKEVMNGETIREIIRFIQETNVETLDLTGGAPELNPHFKDLVIAARQANVKVIDRCNLTVLLEKGMEDMISFLKENHVEIISSMPCYLEKNVDGQRGTGVYSKSIQALKKLNEAGFGEEGGLLLNLVYNPGGASLPPAQVTLEQDYKKNLWEMHGIRFSHLYTIINMPINRFGRKLESDQKLDGYMKLLKENHRPENLEHIMCKSLISVDWQGYVYDCDFNQMLHIPLGDMSPLHISNLKIEELEGMNIAVRDHCFGCTAGTGSSCGGALS